MQPQESYTLYVEGWERDPIYDDFLGDLQVQLTGYHQDVRYGTHKVKADHACEKIPVIMDPCSVKNPGAFSIEFEIRPAPLPDLEPTGIKVYDLPGSPQKLVCPVIKNSGSELAGAFDVTLHLDRSLTPLAKMTAGRLGAGEQGELCGEVTLPAGQHTLLAVVDQAESQIEINERNNTASRGYPAETIAQAAPTPGATPEAPAPTTTSKPSPEPAASPTASPANGQPPQPQETGKTDLIVSAVKLNKQVPDGKDDCKDGKNAVAVVVKNTGAAGAGKFTVRLTADGKDAGEQSVDGLEAGKEREIRFDEVQLKKGSHTLAATLDSKGTLAEADESNNSQSVTATCQPAN
jgi:hypothetical protein